MKKASVPRRRIYPYNPKLKEYARQLRNDCTRTEKMLWQCLKGKQIKEYDFYRHKPIENYILDFFCHELELGIELDGYTHQFEHVKKSDGRKEECMKKYGIVILRFTDDEVLRNLDLVVKKIELWIAEFERRK